MSADALLVTFDPAGEIEGWLHLADGVIRTRGAGLEALPPLADPVTGDPVRVAAIVPGEAVALHWLEVPRGLAPAQAAAAARLIAGEVSAQPLTDMHLALGEEAEEGDLRPAALVPSLAMLNWIGKLQAEGLDPDLILPEPLLLAAPDEGFTRFDRGSVSLYRGRTDAFAIEPDLADLIVADAPVTSLPPEAFEAGLAAAVSATLVNLRQGPFAKRTRWKIDWPTVRRLAGLALAILLVTLAIQLAAIWRTNAAADAAEAELRQAASRAVPTIGPSSDPARALQQRLADLRGGGVGYSRIAAAVFGAVSATPNVELTGFVFDPDGSLRLTAQADTPATIDSLRARIEAAGFRADAGPGRSGGGRAISELTVRAP